MNLKQYQVDAFAEKPFEGNPAAVVPLNSWLPDRVLRAIAEENNLSATAYFVKSGDRYDLRWFTPVAEVDLCGHATLASAHVLFAHEGFRGESISFTTRSGELVVTRVGSQLEVSFPSREPVPCPAPEVLVKALGVVPDEVLAADDYVVVYQTESIIRSIVPDLALLREIDLRGVVVTAPGQEADFVSRFFAPKFGLPEDPVTGSAHCELAPYWGKRLHRSSMRAFQCSRRGGWVGCRLAEGRVLLTGQAVTFMEATLSV
jgi:PhzF family phenazine biosynthesis protein